jgi:hypothetical protein
MLQRSVEGNVYGQCHKFEVLEVLWNSFIVTSYQGQSECYANHEQILLASVKETEEVKRASSISISIKNHFSPHPHPKKPHCVIFFIK